MRKFCIAAFLFFLLPAAAGAKNKPVLPEIDRIRLAEAFRIGEKLQDRIWPGWSRAPFAVLLIADDHEFLIRHPKPSGEFESVGYDELLKSEIFVRPRRFQKNFLATFPAFGPTPVIVVGRAENTSEKTSTPWVFVVLHEHFHQLQFSQPGYFDEVGALDLARGDATGMWQINYPFPYQTPEIAQSFKELSERLAATYRAPAGRQQAEKLREYLVQRQKLAGMLAADDYRYASFQLWQEGIARYTEYRAAELAARKIKPGKSFRALKDFTPFADEARRLERQMLDELANIDLAKAQRVAFYPFGAVEGLLLDRVSPDWRARYFTRKFALENFYPPQPAKK